MSDPYQVLGISRDATDDEVKKAYRQLSRKYHPDSNINNPNKDKAEEMFKLVQQAYQQVMYERQHPYASSGFGTGSYGFGTQSAYQQDNSEEAIHLRAAASYINHGMFQEALNVLDAMEERSAQWYYYSAAANSGIGNDAVALEHAQQAVSMEPDNQIFQNMLQQIQSGSKWYSSRQQTYGSPVTAGNQCMRVCATYLCLNALCNIFCCGNGRSC